MIIDEHIENLGSIVTNIETNIEPIMPLLIKKLGKEPLNNGPLREFTRQIQEHPRNTGEALSIVREYVGDIKENAISLQTYINRDRKKISGNKVVVDITGDAIQNMNGIVIFTSNILTTLFMNVNSMSKGKRIELVEGVSKYSKLYLGYKDYNLIEELKEIPAGTPKTMLTGIIGQDALISIVGFANSIIYSIGKMWKRKQLRQMKLLRKRKELIELEILALEMSGQDAADIQKKTEYYKDVITELELELSTLED